MTSRRLISAVVTATGIVLGVAAFLVFEWFFIPPRGTLHIANPIDWLLLLPFIIAAVLLTRVASDARRLREREEADRLKDAVLASVAHDLRTPLTTITALAHEMRELGDERSEVIAEQAERLGRYVTDILDLSRLNAGAVPLHAALNAVDDVLTAVVDETEGRAGAGRLVVSVSPPGAILAGRFDVALTTRILVNLVDNAFKYSPSGEPIELAVRADGPRLAFTVRDRGPGVPEAERERIFSAFYRPAGAPDDVGSAGLGLAVARRMAELQQGTLDCRAREGGGSVFTLTLPGASVADLAAIDRASAGL